MTFRWIFLGFLCVQMFATSAFGQDPDPLSEFPTCAEQGARFAARFTVIAHLQNQGDVVFPAGSAVGTRGESRRLEGFQFNMENLPPLVRLEYRARVAGVGTTRWTSPGTFVGSRGESRRLEGVAFRLVGPLASLYSVRYRTHISNLGDTPWGADGDYVGTTDGVNGVEAFEMEIVPASAL
jgi:uncharacterized protein YjdB